MDYNTCKGSKFWSLMENCYQFKAIPIIQSICTGGNFELDAMYTVFCQIEAILNSRPITTISDDPKDTVPLSSLILINGLWSSQLPFVADPTIEELHEAEQCPRKYSTTCTD